MKKNTDALLIGLTLAIISWFTLKFLPDESIIPWVLVAFLCGFLLKSTAQNKTKKDKFDLSRTSNQLEPLNIEELKSRLELVIDGTNDGIWDWDIEKNQVFWSDRVYQLLGMGRGELGTQFDRLKSLMPSEDRIEFDKMLRNHLQFSAPFDVESRLLLKSQQSQDQEKFFLFRGKALRNEQNQAVRMAGSITDITKRKSAEKKLTRNAYYDTLTDVPNRTFFMETLQKFIQQPENRRKENASIAVLLLNLDKFKQINEALGNHIGDELLKQTAKRLDRCKEPRDVLARVGGDEFAFIMNQVEDATLVASKVKRELARSFMIEGREVFLSVGMGLAVETESINTPDVILGNAITAMKRAKRKGNDSLELFSLQMKEQERTYDQMLGELKHALERHQLFLLYQPIVDTKTKRIAGFEALARWMHPEYGLVSPVKFIPIAEESGFILPMGEWILRRACQQVKQWIDLGYTDLVMAVNVSAPQFAHQDMPKLVKKVLEEINLSPKNLKIEITESVAMIDIERTIETLNALKNLGLQISIDDFGTGYSSLSYLKRFPINTLKIDRSFVMDIPNDPITSTIIDMAKNLKLDIIAEGVETQEQFEYLANNQCSQIQGYYFSKPIESAKALELLSQIEHFPNHAIPSEILFQEKIEDESKFASTGSV